MLSKLKSWDWSGFDYMLYRKALFAISNKLYFEGEFWSATGFLSNAFAYSDSFYINNLIFEAPKIDYTHFIKEQPDDAPSYFIAYNLACDYSKISEFEKAIYWLSIAVQINKNLKEQAKNDPDLNNLRQYKLSEYSSIVN
jgi:hypothetical protein